MDPTPIINASFELQLHLVFALIAMVVGPVALFRTRRDRLHKVTGYIWVGGIVGLAVTGFFIPSFHPVLGHFGPIHLFSVLALHGVIMAMYHIFKGNVEQHEMIMKNVWYGGMGVAALLNFLPGRTLNKTLFGEPSNLGFFIVGIGFSLLVLLWIRTQKPQHETTRSTLKLPFSSSN